MKKRIFSIITSLVLVVSMLAVVPTMTVSAGQADDIANIACSYIGYKYSTFGLNGNWCCRFAWKCADWAGVYSSIIPHTDTCQTMYDTMINNGTGYVVSSAKRGDLVFYKGSSGKFGHVGIMIDSSNVVSGNMGVTGGNNSWSNTKVVQCKVGAINGYASYVFVRPAYRSDTVPDAPQLSINTKACTANDTVNISWPSANGATSYWLHIYRNGNDYINQSLGTSLSYSSTYPKGGYTAYVTSCNSAGETSSYVNFIVYGDKPGKPSLSINKTSASINDTIKISWSATSNTEYYWLHIYKDGKDYENKSLGTALSYSNKYPAGKYRAYIVSINPCGETLSYVDFKVYGENPSKAILNINKTKATPDDTITITWDETSNTEHYWLHIYKDHEDYENKSLGTALSYSNKYPVGQYKAYIVPMNPYGETLSYVEFTISETAPAELKYQLRYNDDSTDVRFILIADEQEVINADSASVYATIDDYGDTDSIVIKRAYRSIKAGGKTITADQGKVFLLGKFIGIPDDMINGMVGHFTLGENTYERTIAS